MNFKIENNLKSDSLIIKFIENDLAMMELEAISLTFYFEDFSIGTVNTLRKCLANVKTLKGLKIILNNKKS